MVSLPPTSSSYPLPPASLLLPSLHPNQPICLDQRDYHVLIHTTSANHAANGYTPPASVSAATTSPTSTSAPSAPARRVPFVDEASASRRGVCSRRRNRICRIRIRRISISINISISIRWPVRAMGARWGIRVGMEGGLGDMISLVWWI